jgi:hypothetical protein
MIFWLLGWVLLGFIGRGLLIGTAKKNWPWFIHRAGGSSDERRRLNFWSTVLGLIFLGLVVYNIILDGDAVGFSTTFRLSEEEKIRV